MNDWHEPEQPGGTPQLTPPDVGPHGPAAQPQADQGAAEIPALACVGGRQRPQQGHSLLVRGQGLGLLTQLPVHRPHLDESIGGFSPPFRLALRNIAKDLLRLQAGWCVARRMAPPEGGRTLDWKDADGSRGGHR